MGMEEGWASDPEFVWGAWLVKEIGTKTKSSKELIFLLCGLDL